MNTILHDYPHFELPRLKKRDTCTERARVFVDYVSRNRGTISSTRTLVIEATLHYPDRIEHNVWIPLSLTGSTGGVTGYFADSSTEDKLQIIRQLLGDVEVIFRSNLCIREWNLVEYDNPPETL